MKTLTVKQLIEKLKTMPAGHLVMYDDRAEDLLLRVRSVSKGADEDGESVVILGGM